MINNLDLFGNYSVAVKTLKNNLNLDAKASGEIKLLKSFEIKKMIKTPKPSHFPALPTSNSTLSATPIPNPNLSPGQILMQNLGLVNQELNVRRE